MEVLCNTGVEMGFAWRNQMEWDEREGSFSQEFNKVERNHAHVRCSDQN